MRIRPEVLSHRVHLVIIGALLQAASACGDDPAIVSPASPGSPKPGSPRKATLTIVSGDRQSGEVGTPLPEPLVVALRDSLGSPMPSVFVRFGNASTIGDSVPTDDRGVASARWTLGPKATTQRIGASATIYSGTRATLLDTAFTATALSGPAVRVGFTTTEEFGSPGSVIDTVTAILTDRFDNGVPYALMAWAVELGDGSVRGLSSKTDVDGVARAIWTLGAQVGEQVLTASSGSAAGRLTATATANAAFPAVSVAVGSEHTCALSRSGAAYCWGSNEFGQLGGGTTDLFAHASPSRVAGRLSFTQLVAGAAHTCGLTAAGEVYCWGANQSGQLGVAWDHADVPIRVPTPQRFTALTAGGVHTCGLTINRTIYCWGDNTIGQLGDGIDRSTRVARVIRRDPAPIVGEMSFIALAASFFGTCAIATTGQAYCWGGNRDGELGTHRGICRGLNDEPYTSPAEWDWPCSTSPAAIDSQESLMSLTANGGGVCGVTTAGGLLCWGGYYIRPTVIPGARVSAAWSLGGTVCAVEASDAVSCWGIWDKTDRVPPPFGDGITLVSLSKMGAICGLSRTQPPIAYCWGSNSKGQVGDGTTAQRYTPAAVGRPRKSS